MSIEPIFRIGRLVMRTIAQGPNVDLIRGAGFYFKAVKSASMSHIARPDVRDYVFSRDGYKCKSCGTDKSLAIDHIISVANCAQGMITIEQLNHINNLQTLCKSCNSSKKHK